MSARPYTRIATALADLPLSEARAVLAEVRADLDAGRLRIPQPRSTAGRTIPPATLPRRGCPSLLAYRAHLAAGEDCPACAAYAERVGTTP